MACKATYFDHNGNIYTAPGLLPYLGWEWGIPWYPTLTLVVKSANEAKGPDYTGARTCMVSCLTRLSLNTTYTCSEYEACTFQTFSYQPITGPTWN